MRAVIRAVIVVAVTVVATAPATLFAQSLQIASGGKIHDRHILARFGAGSVTGGGTAGFVVGANSEKSDAWFAGSGTALPPIDRLELYYDDPEMGSIKFFTSPASSSLQSRWTMSIPSISAAAVDALLNGTVHVGMVDVNDIRIASIQLNESPLLQQSGSFEHENGTDDTASYRITCSLNNRLPSLPFRYAVLRPSAPAPPGSAQASLKSPFTALASSFPHLTCFLGRRTR